MRVIYVTVVFVTMTSALIAVQWVLRTFKLPGWGAVATRYYKILCSVLGIHVRIVGEPVRGRPVLIVANHMSWADIPVIGTITPLAFVSKSEIAKWPLIGPAAKAQHTVFVDRSRRQQTGDAIAEMAQRLQQNIPVVLFAEGTSSDGNRVLPFRSSLVGAVKDVFAQKKGEVEVLIQPMSICYTGHQGLPMGRQHRPLVAWYGDLDFTPHLKEFIHRGAMDAVVTFGEPISFSADRKTVTKAIESTVRKLTAAALRGRPLALEKTEDPPANAA